MFLELTANDGSNAIVININSIQSIRLQPNSELAYDQTDDAYEVLFTLNNSDTHRLRFSDAEQASEYFTKISQLIGAKQMYVPS